MGCGGSASKGNAKEDEKSKSVDAAGQTKTAEPAEQLSPATKRASVAGVSTEIKLLAKIEIVGGLNLPAMDRSGKSDPFVVVSFGRTKFRTSTCKKDVNPKWEQLVVFFITALQMDFDIFFEVWDEDMGPNQNDFIGRAQVRPDVLCGPKPKDLQLPLTRPSGGACGNLIIRAEMFDKVQLERQYWKHMFAIFDSDGSGTLDRTELTQMLEVVGRKDVVEQQGKLEATFTKADKDRSGKISLDEFHSLAKDVCGGHTLPPEMASGSQLKDIVDQAHALLERKIAEGEGFNAALKGRPEDVIWYVGLLMMGLAPGEFEPSKEVSERLGNPMMKMILSESHAMTPEGLAGVEVATDKKREGENLGALIYYQDRRSGRVETEKIPGYVKVGMRVVYGTKPQAAASLLRKMTIQQGKKNDDPASTKQIPEFIKFHGIDMDECLETVADYKTFNEFFYRKLKPSARPLAGSGPGVLLCPADARTNVFQELTVCTELWVKGRTFTLKRLLGDNAEAERIIGYLGENPAVCVSRLAPQDYHRFHAACEGTLVAKYPVAGEYYTVNPIAIRSTVDVFCENARLVMEIDTGEENFGRMIHIAIGATCVASITALKEVGDKMATGEDLGYFAFGGSTCITLYKTGSVIFADDLILNSHKPIETLTRVGQVLGAKDRETLDKLVAGKLA